MIPLDVKDVILAVEGKTENDVQGSIKGVSTDSRSIKPGQLFIPLIGDNFDGHDFIGEAMAKGATMALCEIRKAVKIKDKSKLIFVEDTRKALLDLASYYRSLFELPFVAITGSVGKTTTKNMIAEVLKTRFNVLKTEGNFNNEIGLPLTLFSLDKNSQIGVVEMGMSGFGEISRMVNIVKPQIAVITNIGISHMEKLGSKKNIAKAKMEILEPLKPNDLAILNADSVELWEMREKLPCKSLFFGINRGDLRAENIKSHRDKGVSFDVVNGAGIYNLNIPLPGVHNVYNALAAIAVGFEFGLTERDIVQGLSNVKPTKMRLEFKKSAFGATIIDDCYNASPDSMLSALNLLSEMGKEKKKAAVIGDMLELGEYAESAHQDVGRYAADKADMLIAVGRYAAYMARGFQQNNNDKPIHIFDDTLTAAQNVPNLVKDCDMILVKASRGMKMEQIVSKLISRRF
jgi:UDP-N-acetylmuramoyl-tripeptide--D-alanyl-D-alanine ligase